VRPAKIIGNLFVLIVLIVISTIYYTYVGVVFGPKIIGRLQLILMICLFRKLSDNGNACILPFAICDACLVLFPSDDY